MNKDSAKIILAKSLENLHKRKGGITIENVDAEVINLACYEILKNRRTGKIVNESLIAEAFTSAGQELIKEYTSERATIGSFGILQNVEWEGMWDFLRNYFNKNHALSIDGIELENVTFYSTIHRRYEHNELVTESQAERVVNLVFTNNRKEVLISVEPTLSAKAANLTSTNSNISIYNGTDPDYRFTIEFDQFSEISQFTMELLPRELKIIYLE
jgi:hypothetical protein